MKYFTHLLLVFLISAAIFIAPSVQAESSVKTAHSEVSLLSSVTQARVGETFEAKVRFELEPDWHIYWINPGDSGLAAQAKWDVPDTLSVSEFKWPTPERIRMAGLMNYGYVDEVELPFNVKLDKEHTDGTAPIRVELDWLVCKEICIPESATLQLNLPVGNEVIVAPDYEQVSLPQEYSKQVKYEIEAKEVRIWLEEDSAAPHYFYPEKMGLIQHEAEQIVAYTKGGYVINIPCDEVEHNGTLSGIVVLENGQSYYVNAEPGTVEVHSEAMNTGYGLALFFAFLGGMILNAMPCVFPILALKALSLSREAEGNRVQIRENGIFYTLGILFSMLLLGAFIILLREAGVAIGWGFQLQSPLFVTSMLLLFFVIGLSLSGLLNLPVLFGDANHKLGERDGVLGSFLTGVLAVLVASPCAVPFMAGAVGYAFTQPAIKTLSIMLVLGAGLATPYLLLSFSPKLHGIMPKPGSWMMRFKELMAFPMYASAAWLLWVLMQQIPLEDIATLLCALISIAFLLWIIKYSSGLLKQAARLLVLCVLGMTVLSIHTTPSAEMLNRYDAIKEVFSAERLQNLRAQGKPVFVNATAAWCITCKVNERVALRDEEVIARLEERGVHYLVADWTNEDEEITNWLDYYGRSGVPLYIYYPADGEEEIILPQLLTRSIILNTIP